MAKPLVENSPTVLEGKNVRVTYTLKRGGFFNASTTSTCKPSTA